MKKIFIPAIAAVSFLIAIIALLFYFNDPKKTLEDYLCALQREEYDVAYNMLVTDYYEGYLNRNNYVSHMQEAEVLRDYSIKETGNLTYEVTCRYDSYESQSIIKLKKAKNKTYGVFNNYIVIPTDLMVENVTIMVPAQIDVKLNGVYIDNFLVGKKSNIKKYVFPLMVKGEYVLSLSGDVFNTYTKTLAFNKNNLIFEPELPYLKEDAVHTMTDMLYDAVQSEYKQMIEQNIDNAEGAYSDIEVANFWVTIEEYGYEEDLLKVRTTVEYSVKTTKWTELTDSYTDMTYYTKEETNKAETKERVFYYSNRNWILSK